MKKILLRFAGLGISWIFPFVLGATPFSINLQGRLTDSAGNPINKPTQVDFYIYQGGSPDIADEGTVVYKERTILNPSADGLYQHWIGDGTPLEGHTLTPTDFNTDQPIYLQMMVAGTPLLPRLKFASNSYSFVASVAEKVNNASIQQESLNLPSFQKNGIGVVPPGAILIFLQSCPAGFSEVVELRNKFPIGADSADLSNLVPNPPDVAGGSFGHQHSIAHAHATDIEENFSDKRITGTGQDWAYLPTPRLIKGVAATGGADEIWIEGYSHTHNTTSQSTGVSGTTETLPPFLTVIFCMKN